MRFHGFVDEVADVMRRQHVSVQLSPSLAADPETRHRAEDGLLIVEIHGLRNEATASRMHLQLTRTSSERWFVYWRNQFEHLWQSARRPDRTGEAAAS
jgi:hypothetical protein